MPKNPAAPKAPKPPEEARITIEAGDLKITIEGPSEGFWMRDLYTRAAVHLIKEAEFSGLEEDGSDTISDFATEILTAVAWNWRINDLDPDADPEIAGEMLDMIIAWLKETNRLNTNIKHVPEEDDDDNFDASN